MARSGPPGSGPTPLTSKLRILFVIDDLQAAGGTERHLVHLVRGLSARGMACTVVALSPCHAGLADQLRGAGAHVHSLPVGHVYDWNAFRQAWRLGRFIRDGRYDLIQTFHQKADTYGALVAWLAGVPRIVSSKRDTGQFRSRAYALLGRLLTPLYDRVVVVADHLGRIYAQTDGVKSRQLVRIYNGVDLDLFQPPTPEQAMAERARLGIGREDFVVGMVANFRPEKNHDVLFAAVQAASCEIPRLKLLLVGGGALLDGYRDRYAGPQVLYAGPVSDVRPYLHAMDVACLISSTEGFSNAALEFMAAGLPLVVTGVGGNAEAVAHGVTGLVIPPGDPEALRGALVQLHADQDEARHMGVRARQAAEQRFSLPLMLQNYEVLYRELCGIAGPETQAGGSHA